MYWTLFMCFLLYKYISKANWIRSSLHRQLNLLRWCPQPKRTNVQRITQEERRKQMLNEKETPQSFDRDCLCVIACYVRLLTCRYVSVCMYLWLTECVVLIALRDSTMLLAMAMTSSRKSSERWNSLAFFSFSFSFTLSLVHFHCWFGAIVPGEI